MSTLVENVAKVTAAHAALKEAISAKGVSVPEGAKLTDMPALVDRIETDWVKPRDWPDIKAMLAADTEAFEGKLFILYELLTPGVQWQILSPHPARYAKIVVDDIEYTDTVTMAPDASKRYHVAKLYYTSKTLPRTASGFGGVPMSIIVVSETCTGIVPRWVSANGITLECGYTGWIYLHRPYWRAFEGFTLDKSDYPSKTAEHCEYHVQKYFSIIGAGGGCDELFRRASNIREFDVIFTTAITKANYMFDQCYSLAKVPDVLDLSQCTSAQLMFDQCRSLTKVPDVLDLSECVDCIKMFAECYSLAKVPDVLDLSKCINMSAMFSQCACLKSISLAEGSGQVAKNIDRMFQYCNSLETLTLPDGFGKVATTLANCFTKCTALKTITGNPNFKVSLDLSSCTQLTHDSLMVVINGLQIVTGQTLTLGTENLAKLTDDEKKVATDKGWTLA